MRVPPRINTAATAFRLLVAVVGLLIGVGAPMALAAKAAQQPTTKPPSALDLYRLSLNADLRYSYAGRKFITSWRDDGLVFATATQFSHLAPSSDCTIYTAPRSRRGRVIIDDDKANQLWTYIPQQNIIVHMPVTPDPTPPQQMALFKILLSNYALKVQPKPTTVAGRKTFVVFLQPRIAGRPYDHLWIDPYTGLVLRREMYHADGTLSSVSYFSEIKFNVKLTPDEFSPNRWTAKKPRLIEEREQSEHAVDSANLPPPFAGRAIVPRSLSGYVLQEVTLLGKGNKASLHLMYSDGLYQFSLYETRRRGTAPTRVPVSRPVAIGGNVTARVAHRYSYSILSWDSGTLNYTLLGDLSVPALVRVARATGTVPAAQAASNR